MVRNILLLLIMVVVAAWLIFLQEEKEIDSEVATEQEAVKETTIEASEPADEAELTATKDNKPQAKKDLTTEEAYQLEAVLNELKEGEFSQDPFVEASLQQVRLIGCELLMQGPFSSQAKARLGEEAWQKAEQKCKTHITDKPHLFFQTRHGGKISQSIPSTTAAGKRLKELYDSNHNSDRTVKYDFFKFSLRAQRSEWLLLSMLGDADGGGFEYSNWISSKNKSYVYQIKELSMFYLICEWDDAGFCEPGGVVSFFACDQAPSHCALPFAEWFELNFLPGVKKDVAIVVNNLKAYARGEDVE